MIIIDRFEKEYAVCERENMEMINIPILYLPKGVKEGDCLDLVNDKYVFNRRETERLKKEIEKLTEDLWK
ncbi:DUF3006 domain-containing protein [Clostridium subterminale]|uniref:DUF3006 domain-containing protein n=1 Tax=Clostridium subterminale TaxID=1550 RepID=A0ABP3W841_CLOSU